MNKRLWLVGVAAVLLSAVTAVLIYVNASKDDGKWRPDQENWPPAQIWGQGEEGKDLPADFTPPRPQIEVLWSAYRPGFKKEIDRAGDAGDCAALNRYFDDAAATDTQDRLALTYIDRWGMHLECREFLGDSGDPSKPVAPDAYMICEPEGKKAQTPGGTKVVCKKGADGSLRWQKR